MAQTHFNNQQKKLVYFASKEFKKAEEERRKQEERDYWAEYHDQSDEDHDWDREPKVKEE